MCHVRAATNEKQPPHEAAIPLRTSGVTNHRGIWDALCWPCSIDKIDFYLGGSNLLAH